MYSDKYSVKSIFLYAEGYYAIFPRGIEINRNVGEGSIVIENDYIIYFKPNTPQEIKERFIKDYAQYHREKNKTGRYED